MKNSALFLVFAILAAGLPAGLAAADPIKVGEYASLTGKEATFGISSHEGTVLAIEELNAAGGVLGKKFELKTEDADQAVAGVVHDDIETSKCFVSVADGR